MVAQEWLVKIYSVHIWAIAACIFDLPIMFLMHLVKLQGVFTIIFWFISIRHYLNLVVAISPAVGTEL
jgi:hypothetical protein